MILVTNWKMNPLSLKEAERLLNSYRKFKDAKILIAPPFVFLYPLIKKYSKYFDFGAQNIYYEEKGAFTGEISAKMLKNIGCKFVIINHSERRKFGEDLKIANKKIFSALKNGLDVFLCFGEDKIIKDKDELKKYWDKESKILLKNVPLNSKKIYFVYEPSWAISTQNIGPAPRDLILYFLDWYYKRFKFKILYGGSVSPENIKNYLDLKLNGFLIGSQSLNIKNFRKILKLVYN
ncbi:MAG: triose-phosphate isomerase [Minisyncoccia bacterium]